jgi:hypothetical protein
MKANIWRYQRRNAMYPIICASLGVAVAAYIIPLATINTAGRYVAMMMMPSVVGKLKTRCCDLFKKD